MNSSRNSILLPLALLAVSCLTAHADELDTLQFSAQENLLYDSNVFRLSDTVNPQTTLGTSSTSDMVATTTLGLKLDKHYGLQRFVLDVNAANYHYDRFSFLNFTAYNYAAAWHWSFTPALHGILSTDRREYIDYSADVQSAALINHRTDRSTILDAEYDLGGAWHLVGGAYNRTSTSSVETVYEGDYKLTGGDVGLRYVFPSGTSMTYRVKSDRGEYTGLPSATLFATNFSDKENEFTVNWAPTAKTTVQGRLSYIERSNADLAVRDYAGIVGNLNVNWAATAKASIMAGLTRNLYSYQTNTDSYLAQYGAFIAPTWKVTENTAVKLRFEHDLLEFFGPLPGFAPDSRQDRVDQASLSFEWQPLRSVKLIAALLRDVRSSNVFGFDYNSKGASITAAVNF
ncbi:MAG TPA: XrtB/PEP-CTERM-associated polysaccharide biosynthesis outer membrane protein EpsL [Rhodoferax sp.]|nr:XrtB/PEP-CTERM-associated polysaccharide biosynthesis outer membrane protein EpsL [Rhodoferax sp.]